VQYNAQIHFLLEISMNKQLQKWVEQSTSDEVFFAMTEEEFEERAYRLDFKSLNGIIDAEVIAARERGYKNIAMLDGEEYANKVRKIFGD
jgi:hypothetical protein